MRRGRVSAIAVLLCLLVVGMVVGREKCRLGNSAEAVGGILLILGIQTRWVALALSPILIGATWAHAGNGWLFASTDGGWEYPLYLFVLCIAQAMLGDGAYALAPSRLSDGGAAPLPGEAR